MFLLFIGLSPASHEGIELSFGAESSSTLIIFDDFTVFHYEIEYIFDESSLKDSYSLNFLDVKSIEKQDKLFGKLAVNNRIFGIYIKAGVAQLTEEILGGYKTRWQDKYIYKYNGTDYEDLNYNEYLGNTTASLPYNTLFTAMGLEVHFFKTDKLGVSGFGEYSLFNTKNFHMQLLHNREQQQWLEKDDYIDEISINFNEIQNETWKAGGRIEIYNEHISPWVDIGYVSYKTTMQGVYISKYLSYQESNDIQEFSTKAKSFNTLLFSSGININISKHWRMKASASLGAIKSGGITCEFLL
jgi:hypothetical protein